MYLAEALFCPLVAGWNGGGGGEIKMKGEKERQMDGSIRGKPTGDKIGKVKLADQCG